MSASLAAAARGAAVASDPRPETTIPRAEAAFKLAVADSEESLRGAFRLIYNVYVRCRLMESNDYAMRVTPYHLSADTDVFVASRGGTVACTMSLVRDGGMGLPMENAYGPEVRRRRNEGSRVAEVSCLAGGVDGASGMKRVAIRLMGFMAQYAWRRGVDELLIAVHPDHAGFYERLIAFRPIGGRRSYTAVCNKPAVAMALDLRQAALNYPRLYRRFFKKLYPETMFQHRPLSEATLDWMRRVVEVCAPAERVWAAS